VTDAEQGASQLTFTVVAGPTNGSLSLATGFTQADIDNFSVTYNHNGGETTVDYFTFTVSDGAGGTISTTPFVITITPINDAPNLAVNSGLSLDEGAAATIGAGALEVTDVDNTPAELTYTLTTAPGSGTLVLSGSPLSVASTFTQADVNAGVLSYSHDGGETLTDSFGFSFSDGEITDTGNLFNITITGVNDSPVLAVNNGLSVDEADAAVVIDEGSLLVTDAEQGPGSLTYTVVSGPTNGSLSLSTGFTQADVNAGSLTYSHDGGESLSDGFTFTVSDGAGGTISTTPFVITITPVDDAPGLTVNDSLSVIRGGSETITRGQLYADDVDTDPVNVRFTVTAPPLRGTLVLSGSPGPSTFTQDDIDYGRLRYDHDGSSSTVDGFSFELSDLNTTIGPYDFTIKVLGPSADPPTIASIVDVGNDQGRSVLITFQKCGADTAGSPTPVLEYGAFRRIDPLSSTGTPAVDGAPSLEGWTFVASVPANGESSYSIVAPTLADSTVGGVIHWSVFFVRALTAEPTVYFDSAPDSGYSVDNLAPGVPQGFAVAYNTGGGNQLSWDPCVDSDFQYFKVYRETDPDFIPGPGNEVHATADTSWTDPEYDGGDVHYKITALDHAGNESDAAGPDHVTAIENQTIPNMFALCQNVPNPFNPTTVIRYDVPAGGGRVTLRVYDVAGRMVRTLVDGLETSGEKRVTWNGRNDHGSLVSTGVYFYRMTAPGFEMTKKMVLLQ
jgi:VCBS repeat-containing protein